MNRATIHIVGGESRSRAEQARIVYALGHHAEVYASLDELIAEAPQEGVVIASDDDEPDASSIVRHLGDAGLWLPLVMASAEPDIDRAIVAIKAGALDYLRLPLHMSSFGRRLARILTEAGQRSEEQRRVVEARMAISVLSPRERQVLELLSSGSTNKEIAQQLDISPRTVEIHRGNMMDKLGAGHPADAIRLWYDARIEIPVPTVDDELAPPVAMKLAERIAERQVSRLLSRRGRHARARG